MESCGMSIWNNPFDDFAEEYDHWFDSEKGSFIFSQEREALNQILGVPTGKWLEVGSGSGRFAQAFGIGHSVEPSRSMAMIASSRGIMTCQAMGEHLPFKDTSFDGLLMVCTLCFLHDPLRVLRECSRVLKRRGRLIIGFVPSNSAWGLYHSARGKKGHVIYRHARFYQRDEVKAMAEEAGFLFRKEQSSILPPPEGMNELGKESLDEGFVTLLFENTLRR